MLSKIADNEQISSVKGQNTERHSALYYALFADGNVGIEVLADQGLDHSLVSNYLLTNIMNQNPINMVKYMKLPR